MNFKKILTLVGVLALSACSPSLFKQLRILLLLILLGACNANNNKGEKAPISSFKLNPTQKNIIQGNQNGILIIPKDCFVDENGNLVKESVQLKFTEAYSISDIINQGLDTRAGEALLVTGGMVNLEATTVDGKMVAIAPNKAITFQKDQFLLDTNQYQFFTRSAQQDWEKPQAPSPYLTYLPLDEQVKLYLSLDDNDSLIISEQKPSNYNKDLFGDNPTSIRSFLGGAGQYFNGTEPTVIPEDILDKSFLASKEYEERFRVFPIVGEYWMDVHSTYLKHLDQPLYVADSFALEVIKKELAYYEKKNDLTAIRLYKEKCQLLTAFKNQRKTTFPPDRLTDEERLELQDFYKKMRQDLVLAKNRKQVNVAIHSFSIRQLGWHNIDYFYKKEQMQETLLKVTCQEEAQKVMLIFKSDKVVLRASKNTANNFCFNRNDECTLPLPAVPAYLIALGEKDGKLLFTKKEIQLGQDTQVSLDLQPSSQEELTKVLDGIEQGYQ